jgi:predicted PurR-regulated permease PerM
MSYSEYVKRVLTFFAIIVFLLGFWHLRQVFMLAFLSVIIAVSLTIPVNRLQRMGFRRGSAIAVTLVAVISAIALFLASILPALVVQMADLFEQLPDAFEQVRETYSDWYVEQNETIQNVLPAADDEQLAGIFSDASDLVQPIIAGAGGTIGGVVANIAIIIIVSIFLLLDPKDYTRGFIMLIPPDYRQRALEVLVELRRTVTTWMTALTFSISITVILVWVLLGMVWGIPNGLALGVIAGVMTIIPNIGSIVPLVPIVIFTLADEPRKLPFVIITYLLIQQLESNVLTPSIVKRELNIPAALIFIFQLIAAALFGFFGILLAVPLLATTITLVRELYVYDILGQRGVSVELENTSEGGLRLVTAKPDGGNIKIVTQTFQVIREMPPEDHIDLTSNES